MTDHATLDRIARQLCESRRGTGAYDRKGCRRSIWLRRAAVMHSNVQKVRRLFGGLVIDPEWWGR